MAKGKKSFVAYSDWKDVFDELPDAEAGQLIKHIFAYVNDENPQTDSVLIRAVFANIKSTLKRDLDKWDSQLTQRSEAGKRSAEKRALKNNERNPTTVERPLKFVDETERNSTVSVNVSVSDNVNDNVNEKRKKESINTFQKNTFFEDDFLLNEKYVEFLKFRKEIKKPLKEISIKSNISQLMKLAKNDNEIAIQILDQSIANGWQGLFELKNQNNNVSNNSESTTSKLSRFEKFQQATREIHENRNGNS